MADTDAIISAVIGFMNDMPEEKLRQLLSAEEQEALQDRRESKRSVINEHGRALNRG